MLYLDDGKVEPGVPADEIEAWLWLRQLTQAEGSEEYDVGIVFETEVETFANRGSLQNLVFRGSRTLEVLFSFESK